MTKLDTCVDMSGRNMTKEDWEARLEEIVNGIDDVMIRAYVIAGGIHDAPYQVEGVSVTGRPPQGFPMRHLSAEGQSELRQQFVECDHCLERAWRFLSYRVHEAGDHSFFHDEKDRCKSMESLVGYVNDAWDFEDVAGIEAHLACCSLCSTLVALFRSMPMTYTLPPDP